MGTATTVLTAITGVGCGLAGGVFLAFSTIVMPALARMPAATAVATMQSINITAVRPLFMTVLFGTAVGCIAVAVAALRAGDGRVTAAALVGSGLYLLGTIGLTMAYNVPRNNALAGLDPAAAEIPQAWARYLVEWTRANHVRAATSAAASALLIFAACLHRS